MELLEIGRIVRPHGLTGRMKVLSYLESQEVLDGLDRLYIGRGARNTSAFPVQAVQKGRGSFILKLGGIEDRDGVSELVGSSVWMPADAMVKLSDGEFYWHEIIGLEVVTIEGRTLGRIESVFPTGSNDVYVCRGAGGEILLPAIGDVVLDIDKDQGRMTVRLLKGLAES